MKALREVNAIKRLFHTCHGAGSGRQVTCAVPLETNHGWRVLGDRSRREARAEGQSKVVWQVHIQKQPVKARLR